MERVYRDLRKFIYGTKASKALPYLSRWVVDVIIPYIPEFKYQPRTQTVALPGVDGLVQIQRRASDILVKLESETGTHSLGVFSVTGWFNFVFNYTQPYEVIFEDKVEGTGMEVAHFEQKGNRKIVLIYMVNSRNVDLAVDNQLKQEFSMTVNGNLIVFRPRREQYQDDLWWSDDFDYAIKFSSSGQWPLISLYEDLSRYARGNQHVVKWGKTIVPMDFFENVIRAVSSVYNFLRNPPIKNSPESGLLWEVPPASDTYQGIIEIHNVTIRRKLKYGEQLKLSTQIAGKELRRILDIDDPMGVPIAVLRAARDGNTNVMLEVLERYIRNPELGASICHVCNVAPAQWYHPETQRQLCSHRCLVKQ